ncbi:MAG: MCE family protein, partial [Candidatus Aminicenantes bacterium]|nr:MCE family protein [Candidatus Aminicenantes bacterium]
MRREMKIGIFLAGAILILAVFIFIVGDMSVLFRKPGYVLFSAFDSVSGLELRAAVRMAGVKIGYVNAIRLEGRRARVGMSIFPEYRVPRGSRATLASLGLIGERYIEIVAGEEASFCQPGETIESAPSVSLDQAGSLLLSVADDIRSVSTLIRETLSEESRTGLQQTLQNLASFSRDLEDFLDENKNALQSGISSASKAAGELDRKAKEVSKSIDETVLLLRDMAQENREAVKFNLEKIRELLLRLEESLQHLSESLEKISRGEGTLGKAIHDPGLYEEAERTLGSVRKAAEPLSRMRATGSYRVDYLGAARTVKGFLSLGFYFPSRYFVYGQVVEDPSLDRFTYSAQGGFRLGFLAPRAGVFESTFGAGVDVLAFRDRLVFSLEGFDFRRPGGPRFRFATQY